MVRMMATTALERATGMGWRAFTMLATVLLLADITLYSEALTVKAVIPQFMELDTAEAAATAIASFLGDDAPKGLGASGKISGTAKGVMRLRADGWRNGDIDDWVAACFATTRFSVDNACICPVEKSHSAVQAEMRDARLWGKGGLMNKLYQTYDETIFRTKTGDAILQRLAHTMAAQQPQVAFLGAGFDTRAYRFAPFKNISTVFEMDLPSTQWKKRKLVENCGLHSMAHVEYLSLNLLDKTPFVELTQSPHYDSSKPTIFFQEGVAMYLKDHDNQQAFRELSRVAHPESRLVLVAWKKLANNPMRKLEMLGMESFGEPIQSSIPKDDAAWLRDAGWERLPDFDKEIQALSRKVPHLYLGVARPLRQ